MMLNPSRGGIGSKLNIPSHIFTKAKFIRKLINKSVLSKIVLSEAQRILVYTIVRSIPIVARTRFVAGPAIATRNSPFLGFL
jgi:hypothetical protein